MIVKTSLSFICFLILASNCCGHVGDDMYLHQDLPPRVYCGRVLARALAYLCYDEAINNKRSDGTMYNAVLAPYYKHHENSVDWPWMAHHKAKSMGIPSRGKRPVVTECCDKACSINELLTYC